MQPVTSLQENDRVKVLLIDESVDSEIFNYRKYYYPHVIGKVGFVKSLVANSVLVDVAGEDLWFEEKELQWIG